MPVALRIALLCVALLAAVYDLKFRRIPNWLNVSALAAGIILNLYLYRTHGLLTVLLGAACALAVYFPLYLIRGMGAGDVKLMAAIGAIAGPHDWLEIFIATALIGGVISLAVIAIRKRWAKTFSNVAVILLEVMRFRSPAAANSSLDVRRQNGLRLPHAVSIAAGSLLFVSFMAAS